MIILTYSGACCGLSFMSVDPVRRQRRVKWSSTAHKSILADKMLLDVDVFQ